MTYINGSFKLGITIQKECSDFTVGLQEQRFGNREGDRTVGDILGKCSAAMAMLPRMPYKHTNVYMDIKQLN